MNGILDKGKFIMCLINQESVLAEEIPWAWPRVNTKILIGKRKKCTCGIKQCKLFAGARYSVSRLKEKKCSCPKKKS